MPRRAASPLAAQAAPARTTILANDDYAVMLTAAGSGYSRWRDLAITRWREDPTRDAWGSWIYLRDVDSGAIWSPTLQPLAAAPGSNREAHLHGHVARFAARDGALVTTLEIAVDPQHAVEVRGIGLRNDGDRAREVELTSYSELVLGAPHADASHPAFSKMFVQTEFDAQHAALLATRRKRDPSDPDVWAAHGVVVDGRRIGALQHETDRARFIGRCRSLRAPLALDQGDALSGTTGTVLDPVFCLRVRVRVPPHAMRRIAFVTAAAARRRDALGLIARHADAGSCARVFARAAARFPQSLRKLGIDAAQAAGFRRLADALLYNDPSLRAPADAIARGEGGAPVLWAKGISGDLPIVLVRLDDAAHLPFAAEMLRAQAYWRAQHLPTDLVILNQAGARKAAALQARIQALVAQAAPGGKPDTSQGTAFVLDGRQVDERLRKGLPAVARIVLRAGDGPLAAQLARRPHPPLPKVPAPAPPRSAKRTLAATTTGGPSKPALLAFNGYGGFTADEREYVTVLHGAQNTPMPWSHLVANPDFGFLATTTGGGYCWSINSQQNQITAWSNDAVCDPPGEVLYLRDADDGMLWSATASPIRVATSRYTTRFGPGYVRYEHLAHGIESDLLQFVPTGDSLKISRLRLRNRSGRRRRLSVTAYVEWALGAIGDNAAPFVATSHDPRSGAVFARNAWRDPFGGRVAFAALRGRPSSFTCDRGEFLGAHGAPDNPAALGAAKPLSNRSGAGFDPCAALQTTLELEPDASVEVVFLLGDADGVDAARAAIERQRVADLDAAFDAVRRQWDDVLGTVKVRTPDADMDRLLNRCLLYQTLACRLWARTAFYQASGAYGFRDQLQDVMALCVARPDLAREHILRSAARQFIEGDVQHWWLPPDGKGVRTRVTDDRLWLPYVVAHYIEVSGDRAVLDETVSFLQGEVLKPGQNDAFFAPAVSQQSGTLFEHCTRAIEVSLAFGEHGLPLIGTGDWNDGMNRVGIEGRGESTWLGWFLYSVLQAFTPIARARSQDARATTWREHAQALAIALDSEAWDGAWYRRAWYDDGTPLGSSRDTECMIDSIAQSWSVISGGGDPQHAARAMRAVDEHLVREDDGLVALFTAPFDRTHHDPGYIKGYPPGLRENGGQYTHGSIWSLIAFALLGDGDQAHRLFRIFDPQRHSATPEGVQRYKVEPYVACADVYSVAPHVGRGGWTWYSGSAGWLYRAGLETLLGFHLRGASLKMDPCIPRAWPGFSLAFRYHSARYEIEVENPHGACRGIARVELDGNVLKDAGATIPLADDGARHRVRVVMGKFL